MKKVFACLLAMALLVSLVACAKGDKTESTTASTQDVQTTAPTEQTEDTTAPTETEPTTAGPEETYPDQLAVIAANRALWMNSEELFSPLCLYTVADFDHNGRLEVWFGANVGTGLYTYMYAWELSEDLTELVALERNFDEYFSQADMMVEKADVYYDEAAETYYYIFKDSSRSGYAWSGMDIRALTVKDGKLSEMTLASLSLDTDENYVSTMTYYDASGNVISEAEFDAAAETYFADLQAMQASFLWQTIEEDEIASISDEALLEKLQEALNAFSVS